MRGMHIKDFLLKYNVVLMLLILIVSSSLLSDVFFTSQNISNLLRQSIPLLLVSVGMLLVIITGGIDLSVGSVAALGSMVVSIALTNWGFASSSSLLLAILISAAVGLALGSVSGLLVSYSGMAPFVVTLAMMTMARGISYMLTNGQPVRLPLEQSSTQILSSFGSKSMPLLGIAWPILLGIVVVLIFYLLMKYTALGRLLIATGSNETAVLFAGINPKKYKFFAYAVCGMLSAIAGIIVTSRSGVGVPVTGVGLELDAIAACVIGGASLAGGRGTVINTVIGVLILVLIGNIMNLLSVPDYPQQVIKGLIIIGAVFLQSVESKKATA
ncbi:ABC transporter permease [Siminovitchia terrae]|uniref:ABC transporter permease n=2 Tax=Siminovitchia terrae TaxID=1914933 RepID=A0A429XFV6_SIMTE|nr:ABC transporter permease [Siminovitchia terrae]